MNAIKNIQNYGKQVSFRKIFNDPFKFGPKNDVDKDGNTPITDRDLFDFAWDHNNRPPIDFSKEPLFKNDIEAELWWNAKEDLLKRSWLKL